MTHWAGVKISQFAAGAGFERTEVAMATAVAWVASQGADHYAYNPGLTVASERRGLWALRVDDVPDGEGHLLWNPDYCAQRARALYLASDHSWLWHPAILGGAVDRALELVTAIIAGKVPTVSHTPEVDFRQGLEARIKRAEAMRNATRRTV